MLHRLLGLLIALTLVATPTRAGDASGAFAPYEDLIGVVADLTWHLDDDLYRFPAAKDALGHDVFQLGLHRLQSWQKRFPSRMTDVATFGMAGALFRLREYKTAQEAYQRVAGMTGSALATRARDEAQRLTPFVTTAAMPEDGADLNARFTALRTKLTAWGNVVDSTSATAPHSLALVEEERLERAVAALVTTHRNVIKDGAQTAERALRFLIEKHSDSKLLPLHVLALGDYYAELTRGYATAHDRALTFNEDEFVQIADRALDVYRKVATWDGAKEKPEGQARFAALDAFKMATVVRYR